MEHRGAGAARDFSAAPRQAGRQLDDTEEELLRLLASSEYEAFMRLAVRSRKNILVSGPTGSGKTTWTKALIREIPSDERLVTIEDAKELVLDRHPNHVRLFYSKDDQGLARVTPKQLLESCLRMKPDRILLAELRAEEAFDYLRNVNSGHPGSITSIHATSAELAFEQLVLLVKQNPGGRELARSDIKSLLYLLIDVVIQFGVERHRALHQGNLVRAGAQAPMIDTALLHGWSGVVLAFTTVEAPLIAGLVRGRSAIRHYILSPLVAAPLTAIVAGGIALSSACLAHWGFAHHGLLQWTVGTGLGAYLGYSAAKASPGRPRTANLTREAPTSPTQRSPDV